MILTKIFQEDLNTILSDKNIQFDKFINSSILITGATGTLGFPLVRVLSELNEQRKYGLKIIAVGRNEEKGKYLETLSGVFFLKHDVTQPYPIEIKTDYIIHAAAITNSTEMSENPTGVIYTEISGIKNILDLAVNCNIKGAVFLSSKEVYGTTTTPPESGFKEDDLLYIDIKNPRNSYPMAKRMAECLLNCYASQYNLPLKTVRLAMVFGAGSGADLKTDNRVYAQFLRNALKGENVILHTTGETETCFCYLSDALRGIFTVLLKGAPCEAYNISGQSLQIREMAGIVADMCGVNVIIQPPENNMGYREILKNPLNTDKLRKLGWSPVFFNVYEMFERIIMEEKEKNS